MSPRLTITINRRPYSARHFTSDELSENAKNLYQSLKTLFTLEEIDGMCFELGINCEDLNGQTVTGRAAALMRAVMQRRKLGALEGIIRRDRPEAFTE